jgi:hypothetical protein
MIPGNKIVIEQSYGAGNFLNSLDEGIAVVRNTLVISSSNVNDSANDTFLKRFAEIYLENKQAPIEKIFETLVAENRDEYRSPTAYFYTEDGYKVSPFSSHYFREPLFSIK